MKGFHFCIFSILMVAASACRRHDSQHCKGEIACTEILVSYRVEVVDTNNQPKKVDYIELYDNENKYIRTSIPQHSQSNSFWFSGDVDLEKLSFTPEKYVLSAYYLNNKVGTKEVYLYKDCCHALWQNADSKFVVQ